MNNETRDKVQMAAVRAQIEADVVRRDTLKIAIERGDVTARAGLRELAELDARLSSLDSAFKTLWDATSSPGRG